MDIGSWCLGWLIGKSSLHHGRVSYLEALLSEDTHFIDLRAGYVRFRFTETHHVRSLLILYNVGLRAIEYSFHRFSHNQATERAVFSCSLVAVVHIASSMSGYFTPLNCPCRK